MSKELIPQGLIESKIFTVRGHKVMLDRDLAMLYGVTTGALNQAVARNRERFPIDFMFQLNHVETKNWISQIVISNSSLKMGVRRRPYAFTENGVSMLSTALKSPRAIAVNIQIMRTLTRMRRFMEAHSELKLKIEELEKKYDSQFKSVFDAIKMMMEPPEAADPGPKKTIGFKPEK
ncbi:MAG: DNA-binding protein [Elusimicrobia bacterium RIFOXYA12_FULL_51_18]|nr:MAG: DNA-binding protein [Elusimicrobia bacterium RIFOXYA12_FULL_51_18]OGS28395.1 MAG: DNA-binding protein [Elusimicrobia bacterium RIFOXYA2_FULL_53_38]